MHSDGSKSSEFNRFKNALQRVLSAKREDVERAMPKSKKRAEKPKPRRARPKTA